MNTNNTTKAQTVNEQEKEEAKQAVKINDSRIIRKTEAHDCFPLSCGAHK